MKKKLIIIFGIVILAIVVLSLITNYLDSARVRNSIEPKYVLKVVSKDGKKVTYWGLGYKIIRYPSVSSNEPYKNNRAVKMGSWFMKFELVHLYKDFTLRVIEEKNCNMKLNKYFKLKDRTLYTLCIDEIYLEDTDSRITLKDYLVNKSFENSIDDLVKDMTIHAIFKDGGTTIYKKDNYTILKCNTVLGNKDVYIGNIDLKYEKGFCQ